MCSKFSIYLPCDIYVSIYVNIYGLKKSTCICLMSYMLLRNVRLPIYVVTQNDLYECQLSMCEHICAQKSICYHICEHIWAKKPHIFCIVSYVLLYNFRLPICCHIYRLIWMSVFYMWGYTHSLTAARNRLWVVAPSMLTGHQQEPMRQQQWVRCPARSDSSM